MRTLLIAILAAATLPAQPGGKQTAIADAKTLLEGLFGGQAEALAARFSPEMAQALPASQLGLMATSIQLQNGKFRGLRAEPDYQERQGFRIVTYSGEFAQTVLGLRLSFDAENRVAGLFIVPPRYEVPTYANAQAFEVKDVTVGPKNLGATLLLPKGVASPPVVLLVHGSGAHDRDESIGPNRPFRDLAEGLASKGIAVLRYDKRRLDPASTTYTAKEEVEEDVFAAIDLLRQTAAVDAKRIYVLGHSLGAYLMPRILAQAAASKPPVAGAILMAGNARPLENLILQQVPYVMKRNGAQQAIIDGQMKRLQQQVDLVRSDALKPSTPATELPLGLAATYWLDLRGYDPVATAARLKTPLLLLQGERDYQVTFAEDYALWRKGLGRRKLAVLKSYPALNHLFQAGEGPSEPAEYNKPGRHVDQQVITDIATWINNRRLP